MHLSEELKSGDICVEGSYNFADYREQLLTWVECEGFLNDYCKDVKIANNENDLVDDLKITLESLSKHVDDTYNQNHILEIDDKGVSKLKRLKRIKPSQEIIQMSQLIYSRMPERSLLEVLYNVDYWTNYTRHFCPSSGSDPKLKNPKRDYIWTNFAYGSNLGPNQTARHSGNKISSHTISYINNKHVTGQKLDKSIVDIINLYHNFKLPKIWGDGTRASADGTKIDIYEQNLLAEYHIRYGGYGGIAYHHVADNYIALFSHFIPCGIWEAVYIIEGLRKNKSNIQPKIIHGDTQAQSTPVFGLAYLLGIDLMPRIRNWKDLVFYKADPNIKYNHIESLFGDAINWDLIKTHWKDMMQVVISISQSKSHQQ